MVTLTMLFVKNVYIKPPCNFWHLWPYRPTSSSQLVNHYWATHLLYDIYACLRHCVPLFGC